MFYWYWRRIVFAVPWGTLTKQIIFSLACTLTQCCFPGGCVCFYQCVDFFFFIVSCFTRWLGHANLSLNTKLAGHAGSFVLGKKKKNTGGKISTKLEKVYTGRNFSVLQARSNVPVSSVSICISQMDRDSFDSQVTSDGSSIPWLEDERCSY